MITVQICQSLPLIQKYSAYSNSPHFYASHLTSHVVRQTMRLVILPTPTFSTEQPVRSD